LADQPTMAQALWETIRELRTAGVKSTDVPAEAFESDAKHAEMCALLAAYESFLVSNKRGDMADVYAEAMHHADWCPIQQLDCWTELPGTLWTPLQRRLMDVMPGERVDPLVLALPAATRPRRLAQNASRPVSPIPDASPLAFLLAPGQTANGRSRQDGSGTTIELFHTGGREVEIEEAFRRILPSGVSLDQVEIACASDMHLRTRLGEGAASRVAADARPRHSCGLDWPRPRVDRQALTLLLRTLADPQDPLPLVAVLRGPLFGISDPELIAFKQADGWFSIFYEMRTAPTSQALSEGHDAVAAALASLRQYYRWTRMLPAGAALDRILEHNGYLALAATTPGGVEAGDLLHAIDRVRQAVEEGGSLEDAADALEADSEFTNEVESLPLEPGRRDVVRLMNLHKAKGLEATVVFLADPCGGVKPRVDVKQPSWTITSVTAESRHVARMSVSAEPVADDDPTRVLAQNTSGHRADAGLAWGTLIHGLLEHAMRHASTTREDL
jgi:hypothetical protein